MQPPQAVWDPEVGSGTRAISSGISKVLLTCSARRHSPGQVDEYLRGALGAETFSACSAALATAPRLTCVRVNTLRTSSQVRGAVLRAEMWMLTMFALASRWQAVHITLFHFCIAVLHHRLCASTLLPASSAQRIRSFTRQCHAQLC